MPLSAVGGAARGVQLSISITEFLALLGAGQQASQLIHAAGYTAELPSGLADGSIDRVYSDAVNFTTSNTDLDLVAGVTSKLNGAALTFADVCGVAVFNDGVAGGGGGNLVIGNAAAPLALFSAPTATHTVRPAGCYLWTDSVGIQPAGGTTDVLRIVASAGTVAGRVVIWGRSA